MQSHRGEFCRMLATCTILQALVAVAVGTLVAPLGAGAQGPTRIPRIGFLATSNLPHLLEAFQQGLRDHGYVEGRNIVIEYRWAEGKLERLPGLAAELVQLKVDVIFAFATPPSQAAKQATKTIPIVMVVADPVEQGFVASLARPGGNITGLSVQAPELGGKQLQLLKEVVPRASRVAILWNPANPYTALVVRETEAAARTLGVQLQSLPVRGPEEFEGAFQAATRGRAAALITVGDVLPMAHRPRLVALAANSRLPAMYGFREFVDDGGLMAYGASLAASCRRAATYVDKILKGAKPADLPVEQPMRFELVINMKTSKALGLTIPQSILIRADQVIQ